MDMSNNTEDSLTMDQGNAASQEVDARLDSVAEETRPLEHAAEQVEQWRAQAAKAQEHWDRLVRVSADFDNYKKRAARERQDAIRFANESLLEKLVPILDNFEMALAAAQAADAANTDALKTGVNMIYSQLRSALTEGGLEEIDATGKPFDPNWHEAVAQQPSDTVPEGQVLQQIRKGYKLKDRLLRPATVIVAKKPAA
jgi:molecular chaperone GrpE